MLAKQSGKAPGAKPAKSPRTARIEATASMIESTVQTKDPVTIRAARVYLQRLLQVLDAPETTSDRRFHIANTILQHVVVRLKYANFAHLDVIAPMFGSTSS